MKLGRLQNFGNTLVTKYITSGLIPTIQLLAQAALLVPPEVALQCVAGHCYYHRSVSPPLLSFFLSVFCF